MLMAIIPTYVYVSSEFSKRLAGTRAQSTQKILLEESVLNIAVIIRTAYNRAKNEGCASGLAISTPGQNGATEVVNLCLPTNSTILNRFNPDNPYVINSPNALLISRNSIMSNEFWALKNIFKHFSFINFQLIPTAQAQVAPISSRPPLGAVTAVARPTVVAPVRQCNGADLVCLTVRLCPFTPSCGNLTAHYQRFGFPP